MGILTTLRGMRQRDEFPEELRRSVRKHDKDHKLGFVMGWIRSFAGELKVDTMTRTYPDLHRMLCTHARQHFPNLQWESIQINYPHLDCTWLITTAAPV